VNFANIHPLIKERAKWAVWRYETAEGRDKPSKPPRSPINEQLISPTSDEGWGTFDQAVSRYGDGTWYAGIGFRIAPELGLAVVDCDRHGNEHPDVIKGQLAVYNILNSFTEYSPSGQGIHIYCFGSVPSAKNSARGVEVYCKDRFMTVTGNILNPADIQNRQIELEQLVNELGTTRDNGPSGIDYEAPEIDDDATILSRAFEAQNGPKFSKLWAGEYGEWYGSQSEADFALVNMLCFYTKNVQQVRRLFYASKLGERDKLRERSDLLEEMIKKGYDRILPAVDFEGLRLQVEQRLAQAQPQALALPVATSQRGIEHPSIACPPGLFGEVARFFYDAASYPAPEIALAGALGFMSGLFGAGWNVNGSGLNNFIVLTAPTSSGKEVLTSGMARLVRASMEWTNKNKTDGALSVTDILSKLMGPAGINSGPALTKYLKDDFMSTVSVQAEFGIELGKLLAQDANPSVSALKSLYLNLMGSSGANGVMAANIWSDKEKNIGERRGVSFSLLGESVPELIFDKLNESQIASGFIGRMLFIELPRAQHTYQKDGPKFQPNENLCRAIVQASMQAWANTHAKRPVNVAFSMEADLMQEEYRVFCRNKHADRDGQIYAGLWGRCHVKAMRIAALVAVGVDWVNPVITAEHMQWAIELVNRGTEVILGRFERGEIGTGEHGNRVKTLEEFLKKYYKDNLSSLPKIQLNGKDHAAHKVSYGYLRYHVGRKAEFQRDANAFETAIKTVISSGLMVEDGFRAGDYDPAKQVGRHFTITAKILET
jgi:hypothetical protein